MSPYLQSSLIALISLLFTACGSSGGVTSQPAAPTVSATAPSSVEANVCKNTTVSAVFSKPVNAATVNGSTFKLEDNSGTAITGNVSYSGNTATFTPAAQLATFSVYNATITTGVQDNNGLSIASDLSWTFRTASVTGDIRVAWGSNTEAAVNRAGGGYKVYHSANSGFNPGDAGVTMIDIPYDSGPLTPTSVEMTVDCGVFIRIAAYSALNPPGASGGSVSGLSDQITPTIP